MAIPTATVTRTIVAMDEPEASIAHASSGAA